METKLAPIEKPSNPSSRSVPSESSLGLPPLLKPKNGLLLTGRIMSVEPPVHKEGLAKAPPHRPYSMNFRRFQIYANKQLYSCQDSRNDEKDLAGNVLRSGVLLFPAFEEEQMVSVFVTGFDYKKGEVDLYNVDTTEY